MPCRIDYYQTVHGDLPVKQFLDELPVKLQAKNFRELELLAEFGKQLPMPYAKPLHGKQAKGLWELRVKLASDITRIFYFYPTGSRILLLHGFLKKTDATPQSELETAIRRMKDAVERGL